jgi:fatty acyl-CoA reductase
MYDGMQGGGVVFLTGATGFVGKVVLEQLLRERAALGLERVYVLIRAESEERVRQRFEDEIVASRCFVSHPSDLYDLVEPVMGDMT